jgi:hypothetical protein
VPKEAEHLAVRQADQARIDFAIIEGHPETIMARLLKLPTY